MYHPYWAACLTLVVAVGFVGVVCELDGADLPFLGRSRVQVLPEEPESLPTQSKVLKNERGEGEEDVSDDDDEEEEAEEEDDVQVRLELTLRRTRTRPTSTRSSTDRPAKLTRIRPSSFFACSQVYKQLAQIPAGSARRDAMRLTRKEKARLPRVTAYCTA